jgi:hypothetical protein
MAVAHDSPLSIKKGAFSHARPGNRTLHSRTEVIRHLPQGQSSNSNKTNGRVTSIGLLISPRAKNNSASQ